MLPPPPRAPTLTVDRTSNLLEPMTTVNTPITEYINRLIKLILVRKPYFYHILLLKWLSKNTNIDVPSFREMLRGALYLCKK